MPSGKTCPNCGCPVSDDALMGLCPDCLLRAGAGTMDTARSTAGKAGAFEPPSPEELGRHFPGLEIVELLGRGGMGAVYKARQKRLDRLVALKILPPDVGSEPSFAERFEREAKALAQLHHPNIVTLYDSGRADGLYYFFMEYVDGMTLRQLLEAGHVSPREALAIVPQICDALQFAHDRGIIHRDIKPENILINKEGRVKIADFGVAKIVARGAAETAGVGGVGGVAEAGQTESGRVLGTPQYMAPEQISRPLEVDHRADIYALGVVFYQMLTGELPAGKFAPPSRKVQVDVRLDEVVLRALEKKPEHRYQQASVMGTQVETIAQTQPPGRGIEPAGISGVQIAFAFIALGLFVVGLLGAILLIRNEDMTAMFGGVSLLLALIFGLVSWRWWLGRSIAIAVAAIFVLVAGRIYYVQNYQAPQAREKAAELEAQELADLDAARKADLERKAREGDGRPVQVKVAPVRRGDIGEYFQTFGQLTSPSQLTFAASQDSAFTIIRNFRNQKPMPVEIYDHNMLNKLGQGVVTSVDAGFDINTQALPCAASASAEGDAILYPNEFVNVRVLIDTKQNVLLVPAAAIWNEQSGPSAGTAQYVWVVKSNQTVTKRIVKPGVIDMDTAEIQSGLSPGEIVVSDTGELREGFVVTFKPPVSDAHAKEAGQVIVNVKSDGTLVFKHEPITADKLAATLREMARLDPDQAVILRGDENAGYKFFANVLDICNQAHIYNVAFASTDTQPSSPGAPAQAPQSDREALMIQLKDAEEQLALMQSKYKVGLASELELDDAKARVDVLDAQTQGDPKLVARVRAAAAQQRLKLIEQSFKAGLISEADYDKAKEDAAMAAMTYFIQGAAQTTGTGR
jgi:biopolymer transport protein ExbD/predicted Ser/Thr protein kinase